MSTTSEIKWLETFVVPGEDRCEVLCAIIRKGQRRVISAEWSASLGHFFRMTGAGWRRIDPEFWAYMPDFPESR